MTPFTVYGQDFSTSFDMGTSNLVSSALSAVSAPFTALIVLWIIVTGMLIMRGDIDTRRGITRIVRVCLVSAFIMEAGVYNSYVSSFFQTGLPNWVADSVSNGKASSTPEAFDQILNTIGHQVATIDSHLSWYQIVDLIELACAQLVSFVLLVVCFAVYIVAHAMTDVLVVAGPFLIGGFLFDATRHIAERWIGKLIGLALLTLLVNIAITIVTNGIENYIKISGLNAMAKSGTPDIAIQVLFETLMYMGIGAFIICMLPAVSASIGGGVALNAAGPVLNSIVGGASGGVNTIARALNSRKT
ncbi:type IV secretion system protein [Endobacter medicaginis]|nr:type IV secretion system protein [Endobacter medicaginis]